MDSNANSKSDLFYDPKTSILIVWGQFCVGVALYTLSYYLFDDGLGDWAGTNWDATSLLSVVVAMILLPFGLIFWMSSIFRLASHTGYHWIGNILFLSIFLIGLFTIGSIYFVEWDIQGFIQWDYSLSTPLRMVQGIYLVLTLWLTGITIFHILLRAILQRNLYNDDSGSFGINKKDSNQSIQEAQPLMASEMTSINADTSNGGANDKYQLINTADKELEETSYRFFEYFSVFIFFFIGIPVFLYLNSVLMSDWHKMTPYSINYLLSVSWSTSNAWTAYYAYQCLDATNTFSSYTTCYARLYFDVLLWYLFVFVVGLFAYITNKIPTLKLLLRKRVLINARFYQLDLISITIGEILFWILWLIVMILIGYYFVAIHLWEGSEKTQIENWARYIGILALQFLSMMLFTISRIRLWIDCFAVSFEHLVIYHRMLGVCMLFCGYLHMTLWMIYWTSEGELSTNLPFSSLQFSYIGDNWTMAMMYYIMIFVVPVVYIFGTFEFIRRKYFEVFYYLHLFGGLIFISAILWHGSQSWRFLIPPLCLYAIDRMIRLANSSRICRVENIQISVDGSNNDCNIEITKLGFTLGHYSMKYGEASFKNMNYKMGQYAFINISNCSLYEWHPFTICSGEDDKESYFQIQNEGPMIENNFGSIKNAQFSSLIYILAQQVAANEVGAHEIDIHIDGPYGKPFDYSGYERVILIGGGIGITPCHSIFSTLLSYSINYNGKDISGNKLPKVDLFWVARENKMFSMFKNTFKKWEDHSNNNFSLKLFATRQNGNKINNNNDDDDDSKDNNDDETEFQHVVPHTSATMYAYGRPKWQKELNYIKDNNNNPGKTLVFVCGPQQMVNDVEEVSVRYGARFYSESFQF